MKRNPREVLNVRANASLAKCQKAYRKLMMELHPDRNGDPEAVKRFKEVQEAWDRLNGKDTDATAIDSAAVSNLCNLFVTVVAECLQRGEEPCERDLKAMMKSKLADHQRNLNQRMDQVKKQQKAVEKMLGRWKAGKDETPLEQVLLAKIAEGQAAIELVEREGEMVERSLGMLAGWSFKRDAAEKNCQETMMEALHRIQNMRFQWTPSSAGS
ncbi:MAG: J domain-containing protein [Terracidiphilus sp.]